MRVTIGLALALSVLALDAHAISRYNSQTMTCERAQATLRREGAVIFAYRGRNNAPLYDRYVANSSYCEGTDITRVTSIPTSDNNRCIVYRCFEKSYDK